MYQQYHEILGVTVMVFNTTFNNISVISWQSGFFGGGNHRPVASHCQTLSHNIIWITPCHVWNLNSQL